MRYGRPVRLFLPALVALCGLTPVLATAATITVTSTADGTLVGLAATGQCELREAIEAANTDAAVGDCPAGSGADTIAFNIPGAGVHTITIDSGVGGDLQVITSQVDIDGYTQPGSAPGTNGFGTIDATPMIELHGATGAGTGLSFVGGSAGSSVAGLVINGFSGTGISVQANDIAIRGNFIGTDANGGVSTGSGTYGILVGLPVSGLTIGGTAAADRNLIAGTGLGYGIAIVAGGSGHMIRRNLIGTAADGTTPLPTNEGILIFGGSMSIHENVIGAAVNGLRISGSASVAMAGNLIGVGADEASPIAGTGNGIRVEDAIDTSAPFVQIGPTGGIAAANRIAGWGGAGILVRHNTLAAAQSAAYITGNAVYGNGGLGIDLEDAAAGTGGGVNANDALDADVGPNGYQNYPVPSSAETDGTTTSVAFTLDSWDSAGFRVEFFASPTCDASGNGEGQVYLGFMDVTTDAAGHYAGTASALPATTAGQFLTMTASNAGPVTSEFSACQMIMAQAVDAPVLSPAGLALMSALLALTGGLSRRVKGLM